ncbi:hypothetical protein NW755_009472 [Fusarium falciforme]|uniref:Zn(2)-C6 fungal-type domain-containing protein n=1 Tax=Fusarium falciforme TaxID=195108 RepID=A0A9W8R1S1_9HYPO|nr:hypothetical protein NW755_009472 [Fusarium falciforme]
MENTASIVREPSLDGSAPALKPRKLRKGTQSCWECKRRKARCTFSAATKDVCEGCKRRGTECNHDGGITEIGQAGPSHQNFGPAVSFVNDHVKTHREMPKKRLLHTQDPRQ